MIPSTFAGLLYEMLRSARSKDSKSTWKVNTIWTVQPVPVLAWSAED